MRNERIKIAKGVQRKVTHAKRKAGLKYKNLLTQGLPYKAKLELCRAKAKAFRRKYPFAALPLELLL